MDHHNKSTDRIHPSPNQAPMAAVAVAYSMDDVMARMSALSVSGGMIQAQKVVEHDVMVLVECYGRDIPTVMEVPVPFWADMLIDDPALHRHFFNAFPDERFLYSYIHTQLSSKLPAQYHMEIMPLIDEYIEIVMRAYGSTSS